MLLKDKVKQLDVKIDEADLQRYGNWLCAVATRNNGKKDLIVWDSSLVSPMKIGLGRLLLNAPAELDVDHRNLDTLDYRRSNLRLATRTQNLANTPSRVPGKYKGVSWCEGRGWKTRIRENGVQKHLGYFQTAEEGARAYDREALRIHGEFAYLNFPDEVTT